MSWGWNENNVTLLNNIEILLKNSNCIFSQNLKISPRILCCDVFVCLKKFQKFVKKIQKIFCSKNKNNN